MVVQHNLTAMNSNRMLGINTNSQSKVTEKLSSGYKINRAADDAAGLSISEKMRRQIRGLTQASANAQDGISCVQTAEGALNEVHDMLQRMNELAVKGENGTLSSVDQSYIKAEIKQLMDEIDRVQSTTTFNEQSLLDGTFTGKGLQVGAEANQHIDISISDMSAKTLFGATSTAVSKFQGTQASGSVNTSTPASGSKTASQGAKASGTTSQNSVTNTNNTNSSNGTSSVSAVTSSDFATLNGEIKAALQKVSQQRSDLGAIQNRLEHTIANLDNVVENTTAAESRIRDTDMATTMVKYANNNILTQAGQAMLAQSNQVNQGVLSLLG